MSAPQPVTKTLKEVKLVGEEVHVYNVSDDKKPAEDEPVDTAFAGLNKMQAMRKFWRACLFCGITTFGVMMDGYQTSMPGSILANAGFIEQFGTKISSAGVKSLDAKYVSMWSGLGYLMQFIGNWAAGFISDRFGRRAVLWALSLVFALGIVAEMVAKNYKDWLGAKMLMGLGQGLVQQGVLTYISEIAPTQVRGTLMSSYGWSYSIGQLLVAIALQIINVTDTYAWKKAIYSEWVFMGLWIIALPFLPESPWFYARNENEKSAKAVMARIYKGVEDYDVDREYTAMQVEIQHEKENAESNSQVAIKDIFRGTNFWRTMASVFGLVMQNWSGSAVVFNYTTCGSPCIQAGIPEPFQASVIVYCILLGALMISFYTIERFGRRTLILAGGVGCTIFNVIIGATGFMPKDSTTTNNTTLAFICLWVFTYATTFAGTCWSISAEVATPRLRAKATAFAISTNAMSGALFNTTVPLMISTTSRNWGVKTLFMFAILCGFGTIINYFLLPETKNRNFSEMDEMYENKIPPRRMASYVSSMEQSGSK
ncbi:hypothetical protein L202_04732 [Cryptococcus amylolentus CBS 6039]|uniref:Major facilitator superfamily (MFS) profile domain-containing protein n=1 Tax=Cryptococcus amylolentus CBS 6039 TaxID=1295533 RepID=A0A1E3HMI7_9TREE|nr:hypothetical protein L202_04732 [Cryptococcus amylolentus CBS 6039]ODN77562.1 hypothetical protein L202_04732 [Cryptococcus amylolentus CBS 6039]